MKSIALLLACAAITSCATPVPPPQMTLVFDAKSHERWVKDGVAVLRGQAFLRQKGGGVVTCAGQKVIAFPDSPFFGELVTAVTMGNRSIPPQSEEVRRLTRTRQCDAQGNFEFDQLPEATWIVMTEVKWQAGRAWQGGALKKHATTSSQKATQVLLTDEDYIGR